ncbi:GGDEF domain-containing protein [Idiomarina sp. HP20-50]|uniref:sensor domain-containing diguanylate cyclase n=1 Tax=Idiomarina sp. HP20-50 TaxID=3070813 RepID=UPI00294AF2C9|nr:GGDEF domain-containing protein [Idiomarina sp. HP20-50]MDV6315392.1 GGDEF domain-containing protein [Idiomarina sp. HP20-50]
MAIPETPQEKIQHLSKKLQQSIQSRKQLEDDYLRDSQRYSNFVNDLCLALSGVDSELDSLLHKLRGHLQQNASAAVLEPIMQRLSDAISQHTIRLQTQLKQTNESIRQALTSIKPSDNDSRAQLQRVASEFEQPTMTVSHYLPLVNQLLAVSYRQHAAQTETQVVHYQSQLLDLLSEVEFSGSAADILQQVKVALQKPQTSDTLLAISLKVMRLVFSNINDERKAAQHFLQQLNTSLESVQNVLGITITRSADFADQRIHLNQKLQTGVSEIKACVSSACELQDLKESVGLQLQTLSEALNQHLKLHEEERQTFSNNTQVMEQKLKETESQVAHYKKELAKQKFRSLQDNLTKLPNRSAFEERLNLEFQRWQQNETELTVAIIDVDHFKGINDNFGHIAGDKTLQVIAGTLSKSLKEMAFVCRYGGEEFAIIFCSDEQSTYQHIENTRDKVANIPFKFKSEDIRITISAGIAKFKYNEDTPMAVFERADKALYNAKNSGRNRVMTAK